MIGRTNAVIGKSSSKWPSADEVQVTYTGTMADPREITDAAGNKYVLYELTSSGDLTVDKDVPCEICLIQGGGGGSAANTSGYGYAGGGNGGRMLIWSCILFGTMPCVIGSGGSNSSLIGDSGGNSTIVIKSKYAEGDVIGVELSSDDIRLPGSPASPVGSGGGGGISPGATNVIGDGMTKYVFGDTSVYTYPICAGGGGGSSASQQSDDTYIVYLGGEGGSNGGNGGHYTVVSDVDDYKTVIVPVSGGQNGGGSSAGYQNGVVIDATDGSTYGSGGGSAASHSYYNRKYHYAIGKAGSGCQGAIFIRILK